MNHPLHILYVGPLVEGGTCLQRMHALQELGHQISPVDTCPPAVQAAQRRFLYRCRRKLFGPQDLAGANQAILRALNLHEPCNDQPRDRHWSFVIGHSSFIRHSSFVIRHSVHRELARNGFDLLWLDKALTIEGQTLRLVKALQPKCRIIGYSPDDMAGKHNQSRQFLEYLPLYDLFFTTKSFGVQELKAMGCPRVEYIPNAYDPATHHPLQVSAADRQRLGGAVGFIGNWEPARAASLFKLALRGVPVRVWGERWQRCRLRHPNLRLENHPLWGRDYAVALCAFDINIGFLSKLNRDLSTTRSVEVPACGAFFLAERTSEHRQLFHEDREAVFFSDEAELIEKVRYYLGKPQERRQIALAGRERCLKSGYSNQERLQLMLQRVEVLT